MAIGTVQPTPMISEVNQTPNTCSLAQCLWRECEWLQRQQQNIDRGQNIPPVSALSMTMTDEVAETPTINQVLQISNACGPSVNLKASLSTMLDSISASQFLHMGSYM